MKNLLGLLCLCLLVQGCSPNHAKLEQKILAYDPSFQEVLKKRDLVKGQLFSQRNVFFQKKREIEKAVDALKHEKAKSQREYENGVENAKRQILPEKKALENTFVDTKRKYAQRKIELVSIDKDIEEINALMKKKDRLSITPEETRVWLDRLTLLSEKKSAIILEEEKLEKEMEIIKMKIKTLEL